MRLPLRGWLVTGIISLGSAGALAADSKTPYPPCTTVPTEADRNAAKGAFAAGQGSFNEADYATAITYWRDAYRRDCTAHALLLNLARAYELKGDRSEAVNSLETFLQRKPEAPDADQIRRRIENLKAQMAAAAPPPIATPVAQPGPTAAPPVPPPPPVETSGGKRSRVPFIVVGAGGVVFLVGVGVYAAGTKKVGEFEEKCPNRKCPPGQESAIADGNDARAQQNLGGALAGIGLAGVVGGLIWFFASPKEPVQSSAVKTPSVTPIVTPGFAGLSLGGQF
jgi:tetratricopeptide (TPR) repeat protein